MSLRSSARTLVPLTLLALAAAGLVAPSAALADGTTPVNIVGTTDVSDSGLLSVLTNGFQTAYPQYTLNYIPKGSSAAIAYAEQGTADGLLVHAASLENQFVGNGYSNEQYGRALFYGDFVLLGPTGDPAGIKTGYPHDIVGAFEQIASDGAAAHAHFVSRNDKSGTNVQEHIIWSDTTQVQTCTLSTADGGGTVPTTGSRTCPADSDGSKTIDNVPFPSWYKAGATSQAQNVLAANSCNFGEATNDCYVLTDRGTYDYLESQGDISNLQLVSSDNDAAAVGGKTILANSFHGYVVNPQKFPGVQLNTAGATAFLDWVTSPAGQAAVGAYLAGEPTGAPFLPDATPTLAAADPPGTVKAGSSITIKGSLTNKVPGTPALADHTVDLLSTPLTGSTTPDEIGSATTDSTGHFSVTVKPTFNGTLSVTTGRIVQIENADLTPAFGDILQPTTTQLRALHVQAKVSDTTVTSSSKGHITVRGKVDPAAQGHVGHVSLYARRAGSSADFTYRHQASLRDGARSYTKVFSLGKGTWQVKIHYVDPGYVDRALSAPHTVTVR